MNFAQPEFLVFLAIVIALTWTIRSTRPRKVFLLAASCYFYAYWDYRFLSLLLGSTLIDYWIGLGLAASDRPRVRRGLVTASIVINLSVLGFFKYCNFFLESAQQLFGGWGWNTSTLPILLPIGISFYTFQTLSYTIDVYRRRLPACRSLLDFAVFVTFFPQLVAGPIVRAADFLPQLAVIDRPTRGQLYQGLTQLLRGFVKKVLIADHLAGLADPVFAGPELFAWPTVVLAVLAYTGQIYTDFSGYSDIAIGAARLLGLQLPINFRHPYWSRSPAEFWRRWHISLSSWLRDYLYIPLGGSRHGVRQTKRNLMITMTLGGLWHGAAWNFVLWGVWHGVVLCLTRHWSDQRQNHSSYPDSRHSGRLRQAAGVLLTFAVVVFGWTLFRSPNLPHFVRLWQQLLVPQSGVLWLPPLPLTALGLLAAEHLIWATRYRRLLLLPADRWTTPWLVGWALAALAIYAPTAFRPFVYFQF